MIFIFNILISDGILALTPAERWEAARRFNDGSVLGEPWFILAATSALAILILLLWVVSHKQNKQRKAGSNQLFKEFSERRGLSERECSLLFDVAELAGIQQKSAVFTMQEAFELGSSKIIEKALAEQKDGESTEEIRSELFELREKLGFQKQTSTSVNPRKLSSRQIPVGRKVHLTRRKSRKSGDIESLVLENNDIEFLVRTKIPVKITPGEYWRVRYYFGASVWEFDTTVIRSDNYNLFLNHSNNVRFINRRRFLRVPVSYPAYVAAFPFSRNFAQAGTKRTQKSKTKDTTWGPPEFVPGTVTELAGPGLRIDAPLEVKKGERILVIMQLNKPQEQQDDNKQAKDIKSAGILEDIAEVKHTVALENSFSIAVELTGLSDTDMNEIIRATNLASLKANAPAHSVSSPEEQESEAKEQVKV